MENSLISIFFYSEKIKNNLFLDLGCRSFPSVDELVESLNFMVKDKQHFIKRGQYDLLTNEGFRTFTVVYELLERVLRNIAENASFANYSLPSLDHEW